MHRLVTVRAMIYGILLLALFAGASQHIWGQEQTFPSPSTTDILGAKDAGAISEVTAHLQAVAVSAWEDLEATGTLTFPAGDTHSAELYLLGSESSRLDITMDSGTRSVRLRAAQGKFQNESGDQSFLLPKTSRTGLVAFPLLWANPIKSPYVSLIDRGVHVANGRTLHRITLEYPVAPGRFNQGDPTVATDLYFDPSSHFLLFSVDAQVFANSPGQTFLRVISYAGYRQFNGIFVPTTIGQTLNGQQQWNLQLSQVTVNSNPPLNTFSF